jgi:DNA-binding MarR family transcriptional regulator
VKHGRLESRRLRMQMADNEVFRDKRPSATVIPAQRTVLPHKRLLDIRARKIKLVRTRTEHTNCLAAGVSVPHTLPLDEQIIVALRRISQAIDTYSRYLWLEHGLTSPQLGALRELKRHTDVTPGRLADLLHVTPQTMAGIVNRLLQRGLINRRSYMIHITDEGLRLADAAPSLLRDRFRNELASLEQWQQTQMLATLQRIAEMMSAANVEDEPFLFHDPAAATSPAEVRGPDSTSAQST